MEELTFEIEDDPNDKQIWSIEENQDSLIVEIKYQSEKSQSFEFNSRSKLIDFLFDNLLFIEDYRSAMTEIFAVGLMNLADLKEDQVTARDLERLESLGLLTKEEVDELMLA